MTTAEVIEGMTDAGQFEILATRVLRKLDPDCLAVVHSGVNAQGRTIANPIDAFCLVPGCTPSRYVMTEFTLTAPEALATKWLFDHTKYTSTGKRKARPPSQADDGDLIKAGREAAAILARHPDAKFVVWLCSNRRLETGLQQRVYDKAAELGVEVRFLEQSRLRDFLDVEPEGQWLRQEHLRIQADQMSGSLLSHLSQKCLSRYAHDLFLPPLDEIVPTRAVQIAADALRELESLHLLVGPSGAGKSVTAHDLLRRHIEGGGVGLWIPADVADKETFLSDAVGAVLRSLHPRAGVEAGREALKFGTAEQPLLLVVDDINRSPHPDRLLRKIMGWSRPGNVCEGDGGAVKQSVGIICPTWDSAWGPLRHTFESMSWIRVQEIGPMARSEAVACLRKTLSVRATTFTDAELEFFAERLNNDPILLGLFGQLLRSDPSVNPLAVAENVIGRFIERAIRELPAANRSLPVNYSDNLNQLSVEMIRRKVLHPRWAEVEGWFRDDPEVRAHLGELAAQGHVCRLSEVAGLLRLEFRHDRILEYQLSQAALKMLREEGDDRESVVDPFFTPFVGRTIARTELSGEVLERVRRQNPVALVAAIPYLTTSASAYADVIVRHARCWLGESINYPNSMRDDAVWTLARTNSIRVLEVTEGHEGNGLVWEARLRNGDAIAGAYALSRDFFPGMRYPWLESLIDDARTHYGSRLSDQLRELLRSMEIGDQQRCGALCLAGYLGDPAFAADVRFAWEHADDQREILLAPLWAAFRCAENTPADLLDTMMPHILTLQHDESGQSLGDRGELLQELRMSSAHGFRKTVLTYLVELGTGREEFRWNVALILNDVNHPVAIGYVVRLLAEAKHRAEQAGGINTWALSYGDQWGRKEDRTKGRLSSDSIAALQSLWADEQNPKWLQEYAFSLWSNCVDEIAELMEIKQDSPHYASAAWQRALRGDRTITGHVLAKLDSDYHWFRLVPHVWGDELETVVDAALKRFAPNPESQADLWSNQHYIISHMLRDIPAPAAERLLVKHWSRLGRSPLFIQAALYHGTSRCQEITAVSLSQIEKSVDPFKHISLFFGFSEQGLKDKLSDHHLNTLLPHIAQLHDNVLRNMAEFCHQFDRWEWARRHLEPEMRRRVAKSDHGGIVPSVGGLAWQWFPNDEELLGGLEQVEQVAPQHQPGLLAHWWDKFIERGDPLERAGRLLFTWLNQNQSQAKFVAVAKIVGARGNRRDLKVLLELKPAGDYPEVNQAAADAEFAVRRRTLD